MLTTLIALAAVGPRLPFKSPIWGLALSPDGKWLAAAHRGASVSVVSLKTGRLLRKLIGADERRDSAFFENPVLSPDGRYLTVGSASAEAESNPVWRTSDWRIRNRILGGYESLQFAEGGKTLVGLSYWIERPRHLDVIRFSDGRVLKRRDLREIDYLVSFAADPRGAQAWISSDFGPVQWNWRGKRSPRFPVGMRDWQGVVMSSSPGAHWLLSAGDTGRGGIAYLAKAKSYDLPDFLELDFRVRAVAWTGDGQSAVLAGLGGKIAVVDLGRNRIVREWVGHERRNIRGAAIRGNRLYTGAESEYVDPRSGLKGGQICEWRLSDGRLLRAFTP